MARQDKTRQDKTRQTMRGMTPAAHVDTITITMTMMLSVSRCSQTGGRASQT
jgi:hypothetical protein